jgi:hypothetical protein
MAKTTPHNKGQQNMRYILIVLCLVFSGCTIQEYDDFQLVGWSAEEEQVISDALNDWNTTITISNHSKNKIQKVEKLPGKRIGEILFLTNDYSSRWATISILELDNTKLTKSIHHEIGHFLAWYNGFDNYKTHLSPGNVMAEYEENIPDQITEDDRIYAFGE